LGERVLCKHEVSGSIPLSSTRLIHCFPIAATFCVTPIRRQAAQSFETVSAGFHRPRAGLLDNSEKVWMFDNEIDWVMRI
jgi:hypothetical protein